MMKMIFSILVHDQFDHIEDTEAIGTAFYKFIPQRGGMCLIVYSYSEKNSRILQTIIQSQKNGLFFYPFNAEVEVSYTCSKREEQTGNVMIRVSFKVF